MVGAGLAGLRACEALRQHGFEGRLRLVGAEVHLPYDRPPLSKQLLAGAWGPERCTLKDAPALEALGIELHLGTRAENLDLTARTVTLSDGGSLSYDGLVVATGARARPLKALSARAQVLSLRSLDDAIALRAVIARPGAHLVIAGAGFVGLEVAATARGLGARVSVVEPLSVPLEAAVGPVMGRVFESLHRGHGVDLRLGTGLEGLDGGAHGGSGVRCRLSDGCRIEAAALLVAVGAVPETSWLEGSGLSLFEGGVECDASLTAAPGVVAAGDLARWPHPATGERMRIEHRTNAAEQGEHAARSLLAGDGPRAGFGPVPYFWSDQYGHKIQVIGSPKPSDEVTVVTGSTKELRFVALYSRDGRLSGALGFSEARTLMAYMPLLERGASKAEAMALTPS